MKEPTAYPILGRRKHQTSLHCWQTARLLSQLAATPWGQQQTTASSHPTAQTLSGVSSRRRMFRRPRVHRSDTCNRCRHRQRCQKQCWHLCILGAAPHAALAVARSTETEAMLLCGVPRSGWQTLSLAIGAGARWHLLRG